MSNANTLGNELEEQIKAVVWPFLQRFSQIDEAIRYWASSKGLRGLFRCIALAKSGREGEAISAAEELVSWAEAEFNESQKVGHADRLADYREFRDFLSMQVISR